jgi:hypothetical protein
MISALLLTAYLSTAQGTKPDTYSEKWLCDLWAGAQCSYTSCEKDSKDRCMAVSKACERTSRKAMVPRESAEKKAACARALLSTSCGAAKPAECSGLM